MQMLLAFPLGLIMRYKIRKNKRLNYILQFEALKTVRNNIEKGSFAYDTILFKQSPFQIINNKSHLANLVCLALLFGDEFMDGIATIYGKCNTKKVLNNNAYNYYLQLKNINNKVTLFYEFDICIVLPESILLQTNTKYGITYKAFYQHLQFLLAEMNLHLNKLQQSIASQAANLICTVCNKCFDTYKVDVEAFTPNYDLKNLLEYQKSKDDDIIKVLLALRATLLHKNIAHYKNDFTSWAHMIRSMQVYDDMQDVAADCNYQMNFLAYFAKTFFITEWQWLQQNKEMLQKQICIAVQQQIAIHMPCAMMLCMQYNKNIIIKNMNWVQHKIQNYLWCKNWLGIKNKQIVNFDFTTTLQDIIHKIMPCTHPLITLEMKYAQILDAALLFPILRLYVLKSITRKEQYLLKNYYTTLPLQFKLLIVKNILKTYDY